MAGDQGSIPGQVIPKTQKMVLSISLLNSQHYKVRIEGKVEQSKERMVWFGLVSLFNGISTFVGYLMPKPFS